VFFVIQQYPQGHGFDSGWGLRKFFLWLFDVNASSFNSFYTHQNSTYHLVILKMSNDIKYHQFLELKLKELCHNSLEEQTLRIGLKVFKGKITQIAALPHPTHMLGTFVF